MQEPAFPNTESPHLTSLRTRWSDEDNQAILNNAVYLTLMEEARHAYFSEHGLLAGNRFPFVLSQSNVRYLKTGRGGVDVLVETCTSHIGTSSFVQCYRIRCKHSGELWCQAEALLVCVDEAGQSCPMSPAFRIALGEQASA